MDALKQKISEVHYHFDNGNSHLGFRMLIDLALDFNMISYFKKCIAIADWQENNPSDMATFSEKGKGLLQEMEQENIAIEVNNSKLIEVKEITKNYGNTRFQLGPISLTISAGQLLGLVGENGNGKTTLLRMLSKDLSYSEGSIDYPFYSTSENYELRTKLTYIPQRTPKWFGKVKDNLKLTATHYGVHPSENESLVLMLIIRFGLWQFRNHGWNELSSGYKMRFELARTFLRKPKLLLLDEPLANLDILSQQLILEDLKLLGKSLTNPLGIVLSSQQLYEVEKVSDEVIFLKNGKPSSFNQLKDKNQQSNFVFEVETECTKEQLKNALKNFTLKELKLIGSNYYVELENTNAKDCMQQLVQNDITIKYFRDISFSTRQFFN